MPAHLAIGMTGEKTELVTEENTALKFGSGSISVYATPAMVGLMEGACIRAIDPFLAEGTSTVGIDLKIRHTAATPVGMRVRAVAELTGMEGRRLLFAVKAFDDREQIGEGTHERFIISVEKFLSKAESKISA